MSDITNANPNQTEQLATDIASKEPHPTVNQLASTEWEKYDVLDRSIASFLGLERMDKFEDKIEMIKKWATSKANSKDRTDILWAIRNLENRLGTPAIGEKRVNFVYKWIKLENLRSNVEKEQRLMEGLGTDVPNT